LVWRPPDHFGEDEGAEYEEELGTEVFLELVGFVGGASEPQRELVREECRHHRVRDGWNRV
jgi:hypothetical protein